METMPTQPKNLRPVKAEILFTRRCPLQCSYCAITTATVGKRAELSVAEWRHGLDQLHALGVPFLAIYGGEPTVRFDDLCEFVTAARVRAFQLTVITACVGMTEAKWDSLINAGCDSITVSLDAPPTVQPPDQGTDRAERELAVFQHLSYLREHEKVRDLEIVMTVSRENLQSVLPMLDWAAEMGVWVNFDVQHHDRGFAGTKCKGNEPPFLATDIPDIETVFRQVLERKKRGAKIHNSVEVLHEWIRGEYPVTLGWKCTDPFWLSVDCNGALMACDDSIPAELKDRFDVRSIYTNWLEFALAWYAWRAQSKCHCFWGTHFQAKQQALDPNGALSIAHGRT